MKHLVGILLSLMLLSTACNHTIDSRLACVSELADNGRADSAITILRAINIDSLSEFNRHYYRLMSIKALDKADYDISQDTTISDIVAYFERFEDESILGEAYYYGGRVCREQGDAPQALDYYQKALDVLQSPDHLYRKGKIASQMGQIFLELYMFDQAKPKFQEAIALQTQCGKTRGLVLDYQSLGESYLWLGMPDSVMYYYDKALKLVDNFENDNVVKIELYTSIIDYYIKQKDYNKASLAFEKIEPYLYEDYISNYVLATALNIYLYKDDLIKAEEISKKLVDSHTNYGEIIGYRVLADIAKEAEDEKKIYEYTAKYKESVDLFNSNVSQNAVIHQNSFYNYSTKVKQILSLENTKLRLTIIIILTTVVICFGVMLATKIYRKINTKNKQLLHLNNDLLYSNAELENSNKKLQKDIDDLFNKIEFLEQEMSMLVENTYSNNNAITELSDALRLQIYNQIKEYDIQTFNIAQEIIESDVWMKFRMAINFNHNITLEDWEDLDIIVNKVYPNFRKKIYLLDHSLSETDYKTCLLVKCRFNNNEIGFLTNRERSSSPQNRKRLFKKLFKFDKSATELDKFILSL